MENEKIKLKPRLGIVDTTFSRVDMISAAMDALGKHPGIEVIRRTVPGIKDIAVECKRLIEDEKCEACLALGYVGGAEIDTQCAHEASTAIMNVKLATNRHILEAFVFENEAWNLNEVEIIAKNRAAKHAKNAAMLLVKPQGLSANAGTGVRQGKENEGGIAQKDKNTVRIALVVARFNEEITSKMEKSALEEAKKQKCEVAKILHVPGSFELPVAAKKLLDDKEIDAVIALGAVVKGETKHDEAIVFAVASKLSWLSLKYRKPAMLGVIGPGATWEQAQARAEEYARRSVEGAISMVKELRK